MVITGAHAIVFTKEAEGVRAFFRDVLGLSSVDAGTRWLIFSLPAAELAAHPAEDAHHEIYLMCDDVQSTVAELTAKGVKFTRPITETDWGTVIALELPGGDERDLRTEAPESVTPESLRGSQSALEAFAGPPDLDRGPSGNISQHWRSSPPSRST